MPSGLPDRVLVPAQLPVPFRVLLSSPTESFPLLGVKYYVGIWGAAQCYFPAAAEGSDLLVAEHGLQGQRLQV